MILEQKVASVVTFVGGAGVLGSYIRLGMNAKTTYFDSPLWLGLSREVVIMLTCFQILAAIGFITAIGTWLFSTPPSGGVMSRPGALSCTLAVFMIASIAWALLITRENPPVWAVALSLITAALTSIVLLAGAAEEHEVRWWILIGLLMFCVVTVLADAVVWNSRFIREFHKKLDKT